MDYFIDEFLNIRYIDEKWNNTLVGQYGIDIIFGDFYDESTFTVPSFYFIYRRNENLHPLEMNYTTIEKNLFFDVGVVVDEGDLFESNTNYGCYDFYTDYLYELMYKYWNECPSVLDDGSKRIRDISVDDNIIEEIRPILRGLVNYDILYY